MAILSVVAGLKIIVAAIEIPAVAN